MSVVASLVPSSLMSTYLFLAALSRLGLPERNSLEAEGDANLYILVEHADVVSGERKRKGNK